MTFKQTIISENKSELEHLISLVNRLSDTQLVHPLEAGWTVSAVLAHLAFWDNRALILIEKWKKEGIGPSPIDFDVINEAKRLLCLAIPPRTAAEMAVTYAEKIDDVIAELSPQSFEDIKQNGTTVHLKRADHRKDHLTQIEAALGL